MKGSKKKLAASGLGAVLFASLCAAAWSGKASNTGNNGSLAADNLRIANLLAYMERADLKSLPELSVEPYALPGASVDVMRVRMEETYDIKGIGRDTVELTGWIAVKHDNPRPAAGETKVEWGTAISDTEFVGMSLHGESKIFGPVHITLDDSQPSVGQVGKLNLPPDKAQALHNAYVASASAAQRGGNFSDKAPRLPNRAFAGISDSLQGLADAIERKDQKALLQLYDRGAGNVYFNSGANRKEFRSATEYVDFLSRSFTRADRFDVKFANDLVLLDGVPGKSATVSLTGQNIVTDREGGTSTISWQLTQTYRARGRRWVISHDHFSTFSDPGTLETLQRGTGAAACRAEARVKIEMPKLDLKMRTKDAVVWYSEVTTIPPVGYTASVSMTPTPVISAGREVGTLQHGIVKFREVVQHVPLIGTNWEQASRANTGGR